jgi:hypothetical protein
MPIKKSTKKAAPKNGPSRKQTTEETIKVKGEELIAKVKEIIKEGNARRLIIKDKKGHVMIEFPLTIGVVATVIAPVLAAIGAIAALITECSITVERGK